MGKCLREDFKLVKTDGSAEKLESTLTKMGLKADQIDEVWKALGGCVPMKSELGGEEPSRSVSEE